jgi:hypothetical protein
MQKHQGYGIIEPHSNKGVRVDINRTIANLPKLSIEELRLLNSAACRLIKSRRTNDALAKRHTLRIGDRVYFDGRFGRTEGTITRLKRVKAFVTTDRGKWDVPIAMLEKA